MVNVRQPRDVAQILLSVLFLAIMIVACLWIVQPFILGFAWAGTVVIATWPVLLRLQKIMFGRRSLAVLVMTLLLVMVFIIPIALLVNSIVDGSGPLIKAISSGDMTLPDLATASVRITVRATVRACSERRTSARPWRSKRLRLNRGRRFIVQE